MRSKKEIREIMRVFEQNMPNPKCELEFKNPYTLLVAVVLSAQSTDKGVNKATKPLFEIVDTPQKMLDLGIDGLKSKGEVCPAWKRSNPAQAIMTPLSVQYLIGGAAKIRFDSFESFCRALRKYVLAATPPETTKFLPSGYFSLKISMAFLSFLTKQSVAAY